MLILQIHCYFLLEKCENLLQCKRFSHFSKKKNNSIFDIVVGISGISRTPNPASRDEKNWVQTHVSPKSRVPDARVFSCDTSKKIMLWRASDNLAD